jgi:hypothetical protein
MQNRAMCHWLHLRCLCKRSWRVAIDSHGEHTRNRTGRAWLNWLAMRLYIESERKSGPRIGNAARNGLGQPQT